MKIKKAKVKNNLFLEYDFEEMSDGAMNTITIKSDANIHQDLARRFKYLTPFFAHLCEEITDSKMKKFIKGDLPEDDELYLKFKVNSFTIGGSDDTEGVTISGQKFTEMGKTINFNSPFIRWDDDYIYISEMNGEIDRTMDEVIEYHNGKKAPNPQTAINFDDLDIEEAFVEEVESV